MAVSSATLVGLARPFRITVPLTGVAATTGGAIAGVLNPFGVDLLIVGTAVRTTTFSTGAANIDVGIGATATTSNDTLIDGLAVGTAAKTASGDIAHGTNGLGVRVWGDDEYLTVTGSADSSGLVGTVDVYGFFLDSE
jgi:hypothetical protein